MQLFECPPWTMPTLDWFKIISFDPRTLYIHLNLLPSPVNPWRLLFIFY